MAAEADARENVTEKLWLSCEAPFCQLQTSGFLSYHWLVAHSVSLALAVDIIIREGVTCLFFENSLLDFSKMSPL